MSRNKYDLIVITGTTASGKTSLAAHLCHNIGGEIISADSRQVYRRMTIGTGKDYNDYMINGIKIPYHLIDIAEPGYKYNIFEYKNDFSRVFNDITSRGRMPVMCGGSGLYINTATGRYNLYEVPTNYALRKQLEGKTIEELKAILTSLKKLHNNTDTDTREHAIRAIEIACFNPGDEETADSYPKDVLFLGVRYERLEERRRITERLHSRLNDGLVEEVRDLLSGGLKSEDLIYYGLEYKYVTQYITGILKYDEMVARLNTAIHQFAKRQMTWFRKMEKSGIVIHWIDGKLSMEEKLNIIFGLYLK